MGSGKTGSTPSGEPRKEAELSSPSSNVLQDRYGSTRQTRRSIRGWRFWGLILFVLVLVSVLVFVGYRNFVSSPIEAQIIAFENQPEKTMEITVDVTRDNSDEAAVCIVRVRDISGAESGRKELYIAPHTERLSTVIHSIRKPVTADAVGCSYDVPSYLSTP